MVCLSLLSLFGGWRLLVLRRIIMLSTLVLALSAAPAFAYTPTLHTQMATGSETSSRNGSCGVTAGPHGSLAVACQGKQKETLAYTFSSGSHAVHGHAMTLPYVIGRAHVSFSTTVSGSTIRVTVTVTGGTLNVGSIWVTYYA
jgi:hypothetical protein